MTRSILALMLLGASAVAQEKREKTVILVHGAFADGSSWDKVIPLLQAKGLYVVAVQNPLTSLADDVAATQRAIDAQKGPVILVGHSWGGTVITEAGASDKVAALVYVAAFAPDVGESSNDLGKAAPPPPGFSSVYSDPAGYLYLTPEGVVHDFAPDLPAAKTKVMAVTQGPIFGKAFDEEVTNAAWKTKPSWYVVAEKDRMIQPDVERAMARKINASSFDKQTIADTKRFVNLSSLPPDQEIEIEWNAFLASLARPDAQTRLQALLDRGLHKPGDVERRLGYHVGRLGVSNLARRQIVDKRRHAGRGINASSLARTTQDLAARAAAASSRRRT